MSCDNNSDNFENGNYTVVSVAVNTNGRLITDEIIQISAYTRGNQCTISKLPIYEDEEDTGYSCVLEYKEESKFIHPDSTKSALIEFLKWIENLKQSDENSSGIILLYYEDSKFVPYALFEGLKKYDLLGRFGQSVEFFANIYLMAKDKYPNDVNISSLRYLSYSVLGNDELISTVATNAKLTYEIIYRLAENEMKKDLQQQHGCGDSVQLTVNDAILKMIMKYADSIEEIYIGWSLLEVIEE